MSVNASGSIAASTVSVAPTETTVLSVGRELLRAAKRLTVQLYNADGSQTFAGTIYRRMSGINNWAASSFEDFASVGPLTSVVADLDVEGTDYLELRGTMSGAGGDVQVAASRKGATP